MSRSQSLFQGKKRERIWGEKRDKMRADVRSEYEGQ